MTEKIQTRPFVYGDECEAEWPPKYGTAKAGGVFYFDKESQTMKEGYPPNPNIKYGEAPFVISDTIDAHYHQGACAWTDSRSRLNAMDKATGCITTDKQLPADPSWSKQQERARRADLHDSMHRAVEQIDTGTAPLSEETRQMCAVQNEITSKALNFDAFNVAGRKNDRRGKKYRRRR